MALLLIDVINALDFRGARPLLRPALSMAKRLEVLARRARRAGMPVIYVNDNFGRWRSDWRKLIEHCLADDVPGRRIVERLRPARNDYFVLKPKHSGFFSTSLDILLRHLGADTLILTGLTGDACVLFTASDAYMRDYRLVVPRDCVASKTRSLNAHALSQIRSILKGDTAPSGRIDLKALNGGRRRPWAR